VTLRNTTLGVDKGSVKINIAGNVTLNNGTLAAARITDSVISNISIDPLYWTMINALQAFFTALSAFQGGSPVVQSQLGVLGTAFLAQVPTAPSSLTGKISSGSSSVFIGG
jgi:hypothetical protein